MQTSGRSDFTVAVVTKESGPVCSSSNSSSSRY